MFDQGTRILSENLARTVDRRTFLKRASQATFAAVLAAVAGHGIAGRAAAANGGSKPPQPPMVPVCTPPGPYCNLDGNVQDPNGCHGAHCWQHRHNGQVYQCRVYYAYYQTGCWTTASGGGYWTCCDCQCSIYPGPPLYTCGCAQFSLSPVPLPTGAGA
ncbi:MAG TPA: hypothetical protein VM536_10810 [Chloroflexia bacterium]|nr:hypothetical protein [Chloroflexia bacterium]